jgi:hypothetical protein
MCYDAASTNIKSLSKQMNTAMVDITWIFVLTLFQAINTILWTVSYDQVRSLHSKEELEENIDMALEIIVKCRERWPGTAAAEQLYSKLAKACLRSYDSRGSQATSSLSANSPSSLTDANSPSASEHSSVAASSVIFSQKPFQSPPQFNYVFNEVPEPINAFNYNHPLPPPQPSFRSNSIFASPASMQTDRRFSYFPPDFTQTQNLPNAWDPMTTTSTHPSHLTPAPAPSPQPIIADQSYFAAQPYFGTHMFGEPNYDTDMRHGSLSQQQQIELMQSLERDGISEIEHFMNLSSGYEDPIKL